MSGLKFKRGQLNLIIALLMLVLLAVLVVPNFQKKTQKNKRKITKKEKKTDPSKSQHTYVKAYHKGMAGAKNVADQLNDRYAKQKK